jgi:thiol-disulfide isomerase/thioredoxin
MRRRLVGPLVLLLALIVCAAADAPSAAPASSVPAGSAPPGSPGPEASSPVAATASPAVERPEWFDLEMVDVQTGQPFTINDYAGKVVLLETMAIWCPTCRRQGDEVARLHELLGDPEELVSVSLDVDMGENAEMLARYADELGYDWHFAVAPLLVARALGNLYSAQYLNPPISPMLIVDRDGSVLGLPFGDVKSAEALAGVIEPLLDR